MGNKQWRILNPELEDLTKLVTKAFSGGSNRNQILNRAETILDMVVSSPTSLQKAIKDLDPTADGKKIRQLGDFLKKHAFATSAKPSSHSVSPTETEMSEHVKDTDISALLAQLRAEEMTDDQIFDDGLSEEFSEYENPEYRF
tara:strand:+ start:510 stop:938 length:429 start_codon:yes stop_codon:yes gene_type:complete